VTLGGHGIPSIPSGPNAAIRSWGTTAANWPETRPPMLSRYRFPQVRTSLGVCRQGSPRWAVWLGKGGQLGGPRPAREAGRPGLARDPPLSNHEILTNRTRPTGPGQLDSANRTANPAQAKANRSRRAVVEHLPGDLRHC